MLWSECGHVVTSEYLCSTIGVPQGSILGQFLLLVYVNDLPQSIEGVPVTLYADDTSIHATTSAMDNISKWFFYNGLILNVAKTNIISFNSRLVLTNTDYAGKALKFASNCKLLGMNIDNKLNWQQHIFYLKSN